MLYVNILSIMVFMLLQFISPHLNTIALGIWIIFFFIVLVRFMRPRWVKNISYKWLMLGAVVLHIFYAVFVTWGQYHVWATGSDFTRILLASPLPLEAPLPVFLEYARSYFAGPLGYFAYYAFGRFFLNLIVLFFITGIFYAILKFGNLRRKSFGSDGPELLCVLLLIVGWPGIVVLIPLGFLIAIFFSIMALLFFKKKQVSLLPAFLIATPLVLIGGKMILEILHLYALLSL